MVTAGRNHGHLAVREESHLTRLLLHASIPVAQLPSVVLSLSAASPGPELACRLQRQRMEVTTCYHFDPSVPQRPQHFG